MSGRRALLWRLALPLASISLGAWATACTAENGNATLQGVLNVPVCGFKNNRADMPVPLEHANPYAQEWKFLVGQPFDSTTPRFPENQVNVRVQRSSARWEFADAVTFWVLDSYEVARCMRHRMNLDGTPDWNEALCDGAPGSLGPAGEGRMLIGTEGEKVRSHFLLFDSCPSVVISADALGACSGGSCPDVALCPGRGSWIRFSRFGSPPSDLKRDFKVNNGETIEASAFHVELCDESTVVGQKTFIVPVPLPAITGTLDGSFSFVLEP